MSTKIISKAVFFVLTTCFFSLSVLSCSKDDKPANEASQNNETSQNDETKLTIKTEEVDFEFRLAYCVGKKQSIAWIGDSVVVMLEGEKESDRDPKIMQKIVNLFETMNDKFQEFTGLNNLGKLSEYDGKMVIEIVKDNCGDGGLAHHGVLGMSTGVPLFNQFYKNVKLGSNAIPQVFFYEINRNYWLPEFNDKFDWAMDDEAQNWGWWTVGMNNAQSVILSASINTEMDYFGQNRAGFRLRMFRHLTSYWNSDSYDFDNGWKQELMLWNTNESINDLMSGFLIYSYENFGGDDWMKNFYKYVQDSDIPNRSDVLAYQECRDNIYRIWSLSAERDLIDFFEKEMKWTISSTVKDEIKNEL